MIARFRYWLAFRLLAPIGYVPVSSDFIDTVDTQLGNVLSNVVHSGTLNDGREIRRKAAIKIIDPIMTVFEALAPNIDEIENQLPLAGSRV